MMTAARRFTFWRVLVAGGLLTLFALAVISKVLAGRVSLLVAGAVILVYAVACLRMALALPDLSDGHSWTSIRNRRVLWTLLGAWATWQVYVLLTLRLVR